MPFPFVHRGASLIHLYAHCSVFTKCTYQKSVPGVKTVCALNCSMHRLRVGESLCILAPWARDIYFSPMHSPIISTKWIWLYLVVISYPLVKWLIEKHEQVRLGFRTLLLLRKMWNLKRDVVCVETKGPRKWECSQSGSTLHLTSFWTLRSRELGWQKPMVRGAD